MKEIFQKLTDEYAEKYHFSGACMLKSSDEVSFSAAYGCANQAYKIKNRLDTRFDTASVTKTFTAAAILQLADKGFLMFSYYPKADLTLSILSNQNCDVWKMHRAIQTEIYHNYYHA